MRKILLVCAALACMTVSPVPAQDAAVKKIIEMGQNDNQVMHQLDILTNRFGGRLIGSDAYENAAEWMDKECTASAIIAALFPPKPAANLQTTSRILTRLPTRVTL